MVATEPLPAAVWDEIGLRRRETFTDHRHLIIYGQRTADDRLAFGGRGAPYHFGSRIQAGRSTATSACSRSCCATCSSSCSRVAGAARGHARAGAARSASPRDWYASVGLDRGTGLALGRRLRRRRRGTTNLAGRTLARPGHSAATPT